MATASATLQHKANSSSVPVPFYFTFPAEFAAGTAQPHRQPMVFLMNGFSVEASRYSGVLAGLAARGFVVAASDYYHNWTEPPFPPFPREHPPFLLDTVLTDRDHQCRQCICLMHCLHICAFWHIKLLYYDLVFGQAPVCIGIAVALHSSITQGSQPTCCSGATALAACTRALSAHESRLSPPAPTPGPGCPPGYVLVTAGLLGTLLDFAKGAAAEDAKFGFLRSADLGRVVLLAHSAGGSVAMRMLSGKGLGLGLG